MNKKPTRVYGPTLHRFNPSQTVHCSAAKFSDERSYVTHPLCVAAVIWVQPADGPHQMDGPFDGLWLAWYILWLRMTKNPHQPLLAIRALSSLNPDQCTGLIFRNFHGPLWHIPPAAPANSRLVQVGSKPPSKNSHDNQQTDHRPSSNSTTIFPSSSTD